MLFVTADVFSGKINPGWSITDEGDARTVLREIARSRDLLLESAPVDGGLGFRGVILEVMADHLTRGGELPARMYLPLGDGKPGSKGRELVERLVSLIPKSGQARGADLFERAPAQAWQRFLQAQLEQSGKTSAPGTAPSLGAKVEAATSAVVCHYDMTAYNPGFWNNDANTRTRNNCYNYANNKNTSTFAQPGRGSGKMYEEITCPAVTRAALADGLHRRRDCLPPSESPRYLVALAVIPSADPLGRDYHWYRKQKDGFWAHKPGATPVRNWDNRGKLITDPATCDRGPYTQFCGYFYTSKNENIS